MRPLAEMLRSLFALSHPLSPPAVGGVQGLNRLSMDGPSMRRSEEGNPGADQPAIPRSSSCHELLWNRPGVHSLPSLVQIF